MASCIEKEKKRENKLCVTSSYGTVLSPLQIMDDVVTVGTFVVLSTVRYYDENFPLLARLARGKSLLELWVTTFFRE